MSSNNEPTHSSLTPMRYQPPEPIVQAARQRPTQAIGAAPDMTSLLKALRRRWLLALVLGVFAAGAIGALTWYVVPRSKYTAMAQLHVATSPRRILFEPKERLADFRTYQKTQLALLKSRKVLAHALAKPEVAKLATIADQVDAEEWLDQQLKVEFPGSSEVLNVSLSGDLPKDLSVIVNAIVDSYQTVIVDEERKERLGRLEMLRKLREKYQQELGSLRKSLKDLAQSVGMNDQVAVGLSQQFKAEHLGLAQREKMRVESEVRKFEAEVVGLKARARSRGPVALPESAISKIVETDPEVTRVRENAIKLYTKLENNTRLARSASDPSVKTVRQHYMTVKEQLDRLRERVREEAIEELRKERGEGDQEAEIAKLENQISTLKVYADTLNKDINRLQKENKSLSSQSLDLENERDEIAIAADVARKVGAEEEAVRVELDAPERIKIVSTARVPRTKDELKKIKAGGMAALGAFACALFGVSFWEFRARRIDTVDEVVNHIGMRIVGALPFARDVPGSRQVGSKAPRQSNLLLESVDATRTMLLHASRAESVRVVMVASAEQGEGKTSLACHLASSLARAGRKTLLVDCDLRRPTAHRVLQLDPEPGVCEILRREADITAAIQSTPASGLDFCPAGHFDQLAVQYLAQDELRRLFDLLRDDYDFIIVDSAPVLPVADSLVVSQCVDAVLFSVLRGVSRLPRVYSAYERLSELGVKMLGAVVTGVRSDAYQSSYYSK